MKSPVLALTLWATASAAHAQSLMPMVAPTAQNNSQLTPLQAGTLQQALTWQPMAGPLQVTGSIQPMQATASQTLSQLQPLQPAPVQPALPWQPMAAPIPVTGTLKPILLAAQDADIQITPLQRAGAPEVMHGRTEKSIVNPVPALAPIAPPLVVTPTAAKPLTLKKLLAKTLPILAAGTPPNPMATPTSTTPPLTDTALPPNPNIPTVARAEDQLIIASVTLNDINRKDFIELYQDDNQALWLPLTAMAQLLEIPLTVNAAAGVAQGWYLAPTNTLVINMAEAKTTVGKTVYPIDDEIEKQEADLYLTPAALKDWFGIEVKLDYSELRLFIKTPKPLPGDLRAKRDEAWAIIADARARNVEPSDTLIPGYADFSLPILRLGATSNITRPPGGNAAMSTGLTVQAENDLFGTNSNIALSFTQNPDGDSGLTGGSILLQKRSETANLLGPLQARYFGLGDISTNPIPLSSIASQGRGVRINNTPQGSVSNPDQYILTGPAPINWDVEVYQNQTLVAFSRIDTSGTYRFTALPLKSGRNVFRLVFYGPNGERTERRETIYLAGNLPKFGEWQYDTALFQPNKNLVPGLPSTVSGTTTTAQAQLTTGLVPNWAATFGAFQSTGNQPNTTGFAPDENGLSTGLRGSVGGTYFTTDAYTAAAGSALQTTLRTPITQSIDLRLAQTRNLGYAEVERDELTTTEAELTVPFNIGKTDIDTGYGYTVTTYQTQPEKTEYTQRTSLAMGPLNATNQLGLTKQGTRSNIVGNLDTTTHAFGRSLRAGLMYEPQSDEVMRQLYLNTQLPVAEGKTLNLTYTQQLTQPRTANLSGGMYWRAGPLALGVQGQAATTGNAQLGLNLTTALVPEGSVHNLSGARWKLSQPDGTIGQGQAAVRVFADANLNNKFDPDESPLPGVTVTNRQRGDSAVTNAEGLATFNSLTPDTLARLEIDLTTLPDIYLKPVSDTLNVKPHAGDNGTLTYAVRLYGEISGQAFAAGGQPIHNLAVTLFNPAGKQLDATTTETDGFFTFGALPMGTYTLATATTSATVTLTPKSRIITRNLTGL